MWNMSTRQEKNKTLHVEYEYRATKGKTNMYGM